MGRSHISRFTARLLWAEASLGAPLWRGFLLMQCVFGFAAAFGCRRPAKSRSVQFNLFIKTVGRLARPIQAKSTSTGEPQSLSRIVLENDLFRSGRGCGHSRPYMFKEVLGKLERRKFTLYIIKSIFIDTLGNDLLNSYSRISHRTINGHK